MKSRFAAVVSILLVAGPAHAADPEAGRVNAETLGCVACHGPRGVSRDPLIPNLAGQNEGYLARQLAEFRRQPEVHPATYGAGRRDDPVMTVQAWTLSDEDIANLAAYFNGLWCGRRSGEPGAEMPAAAQRCLACHGRESIEANHMIPNLAAQKAGYLAKQLRSFRATAIEDAQAVASRQHPIMSDEALALTEAEIDQVAQYFSTRSCW